MIEGKERIWLSIWHTKLFGNFSQWVDRPVDNKNTTNIEYLRADIAKLTGHDIEKIERILQDVRTIAAHAPECNGTVFYEAVAREFNRQRFQK